MTNLKDELIKIGKQYPELREDITPVLDTITKQASDFSVPFSGRMNLFNLLERSKVMFVSAILDEVAPLFRHLGVQKKGNQILENNDYRISITPRDTSLLCSVFLKTQRRYLYDDVHLNAASPMDQLIEDVRELVEEALLEM